jgi:hypothetical protein
VAWLDLFKLFSKGGEPRLQGMIEEEMPEWLSRLAPKLTKTKVFTRPFNHVLVNEYRPGEGIMVTIFSHFETC